MSLSINRTTHTSRVSALPLTEKTALSLPNTIERILAMHFLREGLTVLYESVRFSIQTENGLKKSTLPDFELRFAKGVRPLFLEVTRTKRVKHAGRRPRSIKKQQRFIMTHQQEEVDYLVMGFEELEVFAKRHQLHELLLALHQ